MPQTDVNTVYVLQTYNKPFFLLKFEQYNLKLYIVILQETWQQMGIKSSKTQSHQLLPISRCY